MLHGNKGLDFSTFQNQKSTLKTEFTKENIAKNHNYLQGFLCVSFTPGRGTGILGVRSIQTCKHFFPHVHTILLRLQILTLSQGFS